MSNLSEEIGPLNYKQKYLKYKAKYLQLKAQLGGTDACASKGKTTCMLTIGCKWDDGFMGRNQRCLANACNDYSKLTCGSVPGCAYSKTEDKCINNCPSQDQKTCSQINGCSWVIPPKKSHKYPYCGRIQQF